MCMNLIIYPAATAAKSHQSCPTLCDPRDGSPPGSPVPGILQARTLEWVAISFSNAWKWKVKVKSLSRVRLLTTPWTAAYQAPLSMGFSRQEYCSGVPLPSPVMSSSSFNLVIDDTVALDCILLKPSCSVLQAGLVPQNLTVPPQIKKTPFRFLHHGSLQLLQFFFLLFRFVLPLVLQIHRVFISKLHVQIFESLQLEGWYVGDLLYLSPSLHSGNFPRIQ